MAERLKATLSILRIPQWIKNFFLFAPLIFSKHLFEPGYFWKEVVAFTVFCLISSTAYVINDIADRDVDQRHPIKRTRPLAAGTLTIPAAIALALVLLVTSVVLAKDLPVNFQMIATLYIVLNVAYSFWLKHVILLDVFIVAAGFMIRVLAGAYAIDVATSHWLVLCTLFVSLFLSTSKRRGELVMSQQLEGYEGRAVLKQYDLTSIDQIMTVAAAGMAISYALYTVSERTVTMFGTENLIFTTVFVLFGIFRYLILIKTKPMEDNPVRLLLGDLLIMVNIFAWFLTCVMIIYV
ncbi:MAG TPA: decaprenyl-phosphate phosphoribosyltransferase [Bacteroidota bacterium]|nr:decaprenyl-phosphate phosphoribosyltransferase [Bacteroidota bacterium]